MLRRLFKKGESKSEKFSSPSYDAELVETVQIAMNNIGPRYPGEIRFYISDYSSSIVFEEYNELYSATFRSLITKGDEGGWNYDFALSYYNLADAQTNTIRNLGHTDGREWEVLFNRRSSKETITKVAELVRNHSAGVSVDAINIQDVSVYFRCKPL